MPKISLESLAKNLFEIEKDIGTVLEEFKEFFEDGVFPNEEADHHAYRCCTALSIINGGIAFFIDSLDQLKEAFADYEDKKPPFLH